MKLVMICQTHSPEGLPLSEARITHMRDNLWLIEVGRNGFKEVGLHSASFVHDQHEDNSLALLKAGINALADWTFDGEVGSRDMARGQSDRGKEVQGWADRLRHHRPTLRGGQPEQPSGDEGG